jgi:hypothetical protein
MQWDGAVVVGGDEETSSTPQLSDAVRLIPAEKNQISLLPRISYVTDNVTGIEIYCHIL